MTLVVTADEVDLYLDLSGTINAERANFIIGLVMDDAASVVDPVPDAAKGLVITAAARIYGNPQGLSAESVGPFSANYQTPAAYLTRRERARLRRLAGRLSGAYTVDPTPADASPAASWPPVWDWDDSDSTWFDASESP
jgi:hypothetical protein